MTVASPPAAIEAALARIDDIADRRFGEWRVPGLVYGVVLGGELIHARGLGTLRIGEDAPPTPSSAFRIASMTKSFTAATVLHLRDEGRLRLDDEAERHVPELASLRYPTTDSPRITIRHLLTMTAGFPTDDPWGDRQQDLDLADFSELLRGGLGFAWAPGTRFEYSNTGYGILGRLITTVAGREYREVVRERLLEPLEMASTGYLEEEIPPERLARGYVWRDGAFVEEPMDGYGALASMGGLFTTIEDLASWVAFFLDAFPARDDPEDGPLSRATRREMQQPMVPETLRVTHDSADALPDGEATHYGFGLFQVESLKIGRVIGHGGGYPGFGSAMRWHPASGLGLIAVSNTRYGPAAPLAREQMLELLRADVAPLRRTRPNEATEAARAAVERLLVEWDDTLASQLFAMNIELDEPIAARKAFIEGLRARHGALRPDPDIPTESLTSHHLVWWLAGERGRLKLEILMSPELPPRVQTFAITSVPEPPDALRDAAQRIVAALEAVPPLPVAWPHDVAVGSDVEIAALNRSLAAAAARFAPLTLGPVIDGDGEAKATWRLHGERGQIDLALTFDAPANCLASVALIPLRAVPLNLD